jgi:hypothetical protein
MGAQCLFGEIIRKSIAGELNNRYFLAQSRGGGLQMVMASSFRKYTASAAL